METGLPPPLFSSVVANFVGVSLLAAAAASVEDDVVIMLLHSRTHPTIQKRNVALSMALISFSTGITTQNEIPTIPGTNLHAYGKHTRILI